MVPRIDLADLLHQRERAQDAGVPAGAGAHRDDAVDALRRGLLGVAQIDHIVKHDAAVAVHGVDHLGRRPQAGDDDRHAVFDAQADVMLEPVVARVHDLIDRERRDLEPRGSPAPCASAPR